MDKREAILAAALKLFAERGFYGTPVPLIAEEAQVGAGTIYRYFSNKNSLVNELYRHWKSALSQALTEGLSEDLPLRSLFREILKNWIRFAITNRDAFVFLESHHHGSYLDEESIRLTDRIHNDYLQIFEQGQRDQIVKQVDPQLLMAVVSGMVIQMMKASWAGYLDITPENIARAEEICWEAIRA